MNFKKTTRKIRYKRIHTELTAHATISPGKVYFYIQNLSAMLGSFMHIHKLSYLWSSEKSLIYAKMKRMKKKTHAKSTIHSR